MNPAVFPSPFDPPARRRISIGRRGFVPETATSSAADDALRQFVERRRRCNRHGRSSLGPARESGGLAEIRESLSRFANVRTLLCSASLVVAGLVLWGVFAVMNAASPAAQRHAVQGTLAMNGKPLPHSIVEFHRVGAAAADASFVEVAYTDDAGRFAFGTPQTPGLPTGEYSVVARGRRRVMRCGEWVFEPVPLPKPYAVPLATPLKVSVASDVAGVQLAIRK